MIVDPFRDLAPDHFADLAATRRMWLGFDAALAFYNEACAGAAYWEAVCAEWTKAHGLHVWREGHVLDRAKLRQRRLWRARRRISRQWMIESLDAWRIDAELAQ
jgi:hypothetical protein